MEIHPIFCLSEVTLDQPLFLMSYHDELSHFEKFEGAFFNARMKIDLPPY